MYSAFSFYIYLAPHTGSGRRLPREPTEAAIAEAVSSWRVRGEPQRRSSIEIGAVLTDALGNYNSQRRTDAINRVVVVASKKASIELYIPLLEDLAALLGWPAYLEENDDGDENILLVEPQPSAGV